MLAIRDRGKPGPLRTRVLAAMRSNEPWARGDIPPHSESDPRLGTGLSVLKWSGFVCVTTLAPEVTCAALREGSHQGRFCLWDELWKEIFLLLSPWHTTYLPQCLQLHRVPQTSLGSLRVLSNEQVPDGPSGTWVWGPGLHHHQAL